MAMSGETGESLLKTEMDRARKSVLASEDGRTPALKRLIHGVVGRLDEDIREISYHHLRSILRKEFGVRCSLNDIRATLRDGSSILTMGWGRGENYLRRISLDLAELKA